MQKPLNTNLPADLPQDWQIEQTVSPSGTDVGLTVKHGYNYQSKQINDAHKAINELNNAFTHVQENLETLTTDDAIADTDTIPTVKSDNTKKRLLFSTVVNAIKSKFNSVYAPISHTHGNITNDGKIGSVENQVVITGTGGVLRAGTAPIAGGGTGASTAAGARTNLGITPANIGAAPTSHTHSATDINSGVFDIARIPTIPVTKGGTGASTAADARTSLGITPENIGAAPASHNHNASAITAGTLSADRLPTVPITKGGTGATTAAAARTALEITPANIGAAPTSHNHDASNINAGTLNANRLPTVPVTKGGTGVTDLNINKLNRGENADPSWVIYLSPTGNDANTGFEETSPMKTLRAAVGRYGGLNRLDIRLAPGTYTDTGTLTISANIYVSITGTSTTPGATVISHPIIFQSTDAKLLRVTFDLTNSAQTYPGATFRQSKYDIQNCVFKGKTTVHAGINVSLGSAGYIVDCTFQSGIRGVEVGAGASMTALTCNIANTYEIGFNVNGGMLISGGNTNNAGTKFTMYNSALIVDNGSILNPVANSATVATAALEN